MFFGGGGMGGMGGMGGFGGMGGGGGSQKYTFRFGWEFYLLKCCLYFWLKKTLKWLIKDRA